VSDVSILCVLVGSLFIVARGPLVVAPRATLRVFRRLLATKARVRTFAIALVPLAAALILPSLGDGTAAEVLHALGWIYLAAILWLLLAVIRFGLQVG